MQLNSVYLYPNKVDVFTNLGEWTTGRYRKVYQRNFKVYRGVDNRLDLQVRNADEKAKDITGNTLVFTLIERETQKLVLQRNCEPVPEALNDSTTRITRGYVTITEQDLLLLDKGFYSFSVHLLDNAGVKTPLYSDSQFGVIGTLEVYGDIFGEVQDSTVIDSFSVIPTTWPGVDTSYSELVYASPEVSSANSLHTFVIYDTNYEGTVKIQASQEVGATPKSWTDVATVTLPTDTNYINVEGKYNWFRVIHTPAELNTGKIDKVVYR